MIHLHYATVSGYFCRSGLLNSITMAQGSELAINSLAINRVLAKVAYDWTSHRMGLLWAKIGSDLAFFWAIERGLFISIPIRLIKWL
jgi:hypothetical protein